MFRVMDNRKPAKYPECKVHPSWNKCDYTTFEDAEAYALKWLGILAPDKGFIHLGEPYDYNGYGDMLLIQEI
jgi:hypothetical protein